MVLMGGFSILGLVSLWVLAPPENDYPNNRKNQIKSSSVTKIKNFKKIASLQKSLLPKNFPTYSFLFGLYIVSASQLSGQPSFMYYAGIILGESAKDVVLFFSFVKFLSTFLCSFYVNKLGKKKFLVVGCLIQCFMLFMLAGMGLDQKNQSDNQNNNHFILTLY